MDGDSKNRVSRNSPSQPNIFDFAHTNQNYMNYVTFSEARSRLDVFPSLTPISDEEVLDRIENELVYKNDHKDVRDLVDFDQIAVDPRTETVYVGAR